MVRILISAMLMLAAGTLSLAPLGFHVATNQPSQESKKGDGNTPHSDQAVGQVAGGQRKEEGKSERCVKTPPRQTEERIDGSRRNAEWKRDQAGKPISELLTDMLTEYYKTKLMPELDLKVISSSFVAADSPFDSRKKLRLLVEFTNDVEERDWWRRFEALNGRRPYAKALHFDDEGVRIWESIADFERECTDGAVTYKKGERFRIFVPLNLYINAEKLAKTKRAEIRLHVLEGKDR